VHLVYGSDGDLVEPLRARAAALGLAERVHFSGSVDEADMPDVYRAGDVFSLVSRRREGEGEGIPLTPLEAAACGRPIIVGNQDGSREAIDRGRNGFLVDPDRPDTHLEALAALVRDPILRQRMGNAARQRVLEHHDYRVFRKATLDVAAALGVRGRAVPEAA
jgi:phosphatidyl-myo-inositol dimannoside synthase